MNSGFVPLKYMDHNGSPLLAKTITQFWITQPLEI